jgi:hypothetical protein
MSEEATSTPGEDEFEQLLSKCLIDQCKGCGDCQSEFALFIDKEIARVEKQISDLQIAVKELAYAKKTACEHFWVGTTKGVQQFYCSRCFEIESNVNRK